MSSRGVSFPQLTMCKTHEYESFMLVNSCEQGIVDLRVFMETMRQPEV